MNFFSTLKSTLVALKNALLANNYVRFIGVTLGAALLLSIGNANAQLSIQNAGGTVAVNALGGASSSTGTYGTLTATGPVNITYTYLGSSASWLDSFSSGGNTFYSPAASYNTNAIAQGLVQSKIGSSFTTYSSGGVLNFTFSTLSGVDGSISNGGNSSNGIASFAISPGATINGVQYSYVLDFKDTYAGSQDYRNMLIGVNAVAAPEMDGSSLPMGSFIIGSFLLIGSRKRKIAIS